MNWRAIFAIVRKDLKVVVQSKAVMIPLVMVPVILFTLLPGVAGLLLNNADLDSATVREFQSEMDSFYANMPDGIQAELEQFDNEVQRIAFLVFTYMLAPLYLILPVMVANVIAADSFVGEKERKTLEALLYTPTTNRELYLAKLLSPWAAGIAVSVLGFIVYALVVNVTTAGLMDGLFFPNLIWIVMVIWVAPAAAGLGLGAMVLVSSRTSTFQEAYQLGSMVVLPIVLLLLGQMTGVLYFSLPMVLGLGLVLWLVDAAIFWTGARIFDRGQLISRL